MPNEDFLDTAERLAEERGWTRAELARRSGFSNSQFNKWRTGVKVPATSVIAMARALKVDVVTALIQADALTPDEVSRHASRHTLADLDLVELARATYERAVQINGDGPTVATVGNREGEIHLEQRVHAERVKARRQHPGASVSTVGARS